MNFSHASKRAGELVRRHDLVEVGHEQARDVADLGDAVVLEQRGDPARAIEEELGVAPLRIERDEVRIVVVDREVPGRRDLAAQLAQADLVRLVGDRAACVARASSAARYDEAVERVGDDAGERVRLVIVVEHLARAVPLVELHVIRVAVALRADAEHAAERLDETGAEVRLLIAADEQLEQVLVADVGQQVVSSRSSSNDHCRDARRGLASSRTRSSTPSRSAVDAVGSRCERRRHRRVVVVHARMPRRRIARRRRRRHRRRRRRVVLVVVAVLVVVIVAIVGVGTRVRSRRGSREPVSMNPPAAANTASSGCTPPNTLIAVLPRRVAGRRELQDQPVVAADQRRPSPNRSIAPQVRRDVGVDRLPRAAVVGRHRIVPRSPTDRRCGRRRARDRLEIDLDAALARENHAPSGERAMKPPSPVDEPRAVLRDRERGQRLRRAGRDRASRRRRASDRSRRRAPSATISSRTA